MGHGAGVILIQPNGSRACVACSPDNYVAVIDLKTLRVVGRINTQRGPDGMAWAVRKRKIRRQRNRQDVCTCAEASGTF